MQRDRRAASQVKRRLGIQTGKAFKSDCEHLTDYKNTSDCMEVPKRQYTHTHTHTTDLK